MEDKMLRNITVGFPGLGIEGGVLDNVAFRIGENFEVMWYGVVIALGMLCAILYASLRCKQVGISVDDLTDIAIFTILFGVIGARLYYVAFSPSQFKSLLDIINLRTGGLAFRIFLINVHFHSIKSSQCSNSCLFRNPNCLFNRISSNHLKSKVCHDCQAWLNLLNNFNEIICTHMPSDRPCTWP